VTNTNDYRQAVAAEVRSLMGRQRVTQATLARKAEMSRPALSERLAGKRPFDTDQIVRISEALGVDATALLIPALTAEGAA
jgi:transcriptional regulator with XRE-family HTH domain